ncbi:MAG TPA: hypothetical protein VFQ72_01860 [Candidatus Paceibacterota bacterium]|nr:hypothetical protein [Candidatus Paceibacterota bacterium]
MFKKIVAVVLVFAVMLGLVGASAPQASAQGVSIAQLVELLISLGVIAPDKVAAARAFIASSQAAAPVSASDSTGPWVKVTSPNGGETWPAGNSGQFSIAWDYKGIDPERIMDVYLKFSDDSLCHMGTTPIKHKLFWTIPESQGCTGQISKRITTGQYKIFLTVGDQTGSDFVAKDSSDGYFTIVMPSSVVNQTATRPTIQVTYPSAGYSLSNGSKAAIGNITWTTSNFGNLGVDISLVGSNGYVIKSIAQNVANTGSYYWQNDPTISTGKYQVLLGSSDRGPSAQSYSGLFDIVTNPTQATAPTYPVSASCVGTSYSDSSKVSWSASASGGSGYSYSYSWSAYNDVTAYTGGSTQSSSFTASYGTSGTKQAAVRVTDGAGNSASATCSATVAASQVSAAAAPISAPTLSTTSWYAEDAATWPIVSTASSLNSNQAIRVKGLGGQQYFEMPRGTTSGKLTSSPAAGTTQLILYVYDYAQNAYAVGEKTVNVSVTNRPAQDYTTATFQPRACDGTAPSTSVASLGNASYQLGYSPTRWTYVSGTPYACQFTCANGASWNGSSCAVPAQAAASAASTARPTTSFSISASSIRVGESITLTSVTNSPSSSLQSAAIDQSSDTSSWASGDPCGYWSNPGGSLASKTITCSYTPPSAGTYYFRSRGADNNGLSDFIYRTLTVNPETSANYGSSNLGAASVGIDAVIRLLNALR